MSKQEITLYEKSIQSRTRINYIKGLIVRYRNYIRYSKTARIARKKGAIIGEGVILTPDLRKVLNQNFKIGNHCSLHSVKFSSNLHNVTIGNNVIIGSGAKIIRGSHDIDSPEFENKVTNPNLIIEDYVLVMR